MAFRIARLVAEDEDPKGIVAFTFTEKAAEAIKMKAAGALRAAGFDPTVLGAMYVGTIHAYCQYVLGQSDARFRQFDVLDGNRLKLYLISRYPQLALNELRNSRRPPARYFETIKQVSDAWTLLNDELVDTAVVRAFAPQLGDALGRVTARLNGDQFIDFSLMIRAVVDALRRRDPGVIRAVTGLRHLMVDEFQDVNPAQDALIRELHDLAATLFVVGDDDQAIYSWRGADVSNILEFSDRYPASSVHRLSRNYRSTPAIVQAADQFAAVQLGARRMVKNPEAGMPAGPRDFRKLWFQTRNDEADWIARRIEALLGTEYRESDGTIRGLTPADFAILMRSTRTTEQDGSPRHAAFTRALTAARGGAGIPYSLEAGGGIFDRPQVAVLRDTFELLRGGSPDRAAVQAHFIGRVSAVFPAAHFNQLTRVLAEWGRLIHEPRAGARRRVYPQQLVHDLLEAFGIARAPVGDEIMRDLGVFSRIIQDVETVYLSIDSVQRFSEILNFLGNVAETGYDSATDDVLLRPDAVTIATVHRTKGLEFPVVFVADVEAQRFPGRRHAYDGWLPPQAIQPALQRGAYQSTREEEARLFYTAITRAERYLYVTGSRLLPGGARPRQQSAFAVTLQHPEISTNADGLPAGLRAAEPRRRIDETVVPTSYSQVRYYLRCPKDYQFRNSFGFSPPIPDMFGFGMTVHATVGKLHEVFRAAIPTEADADRVAREMFHLKHVPQSRDPANNPGPYERAKDRAATIAASYVRDYGADFARTRQVEARFEIPVEQAVISGSIDLLLEENPDGSIADASVIDFKAMEGGNAPAENDQLDWTELALQVQLYAKAAREVLGENAKTGAVHLLKDGQRVNVPISDEAVQAAVANVEWTVNRILAADFPMRPHPGKCERCDFRALCQRAPQAFRTNQRPPMIHIPAPPGQQMARAFSEFQDR